MPLTESKPDALAMVYATSLFELAESKGGQARAEELLGELEEVVELTRQDAKFNEFLASRVMGVEARDKALATIFEGRASRETVNFLRLLNRKGRLGQLIPIVAALDSIVQDRFGRIEVDVYTAEPIGQDLASKIRDRLGAALGKDVVVHPYTDAGMIGGVKLMIGDQLVDGSVATRLQKMRDRLSESGASSVRSRSAMIIDDSTPA